jgi:hypothetical protein
VFLGVLFHNENTNEGIQAVLEAVHKYVPNIDNDNKKEYPISQGLAGDQLSVERGANFFKWQMDLLLKRERKVYT